MNELQIFQHSEFGELSVLEVEGKLYFPATACAKKLGYTNPQEAIRTHCKGVRKTLTPTQECDAWVRTGVKADGSSAMRKMAG